MRNDQPQQNNIYIYTNTTKSVILHEKKNVYKYIFHISTYWKRKKIRKILKQIH
jgi:hypothetical protein